MCVKDQIFYSHTCSTVIPITTRLLTACVSVVLHVSGGVKSLCLWAYHVLYVSWRPVYPESVCIPQ